MVDDVVDQCQERLVAGSVNAMIVICNSFGDTACPEFKFLHNVTTVFKAIDCLEEISITLIKKMSATFHKTVW